MQTGSSNGGARQGMRGSGGRPLLARILIFTSALQFLLLAAGFAASGILGFSDAAGHPVSASACLHALAVGAALLLIAACGFYSFCVRACLMLFAPFPLILAVLAFGVTAYCFFTASVLRLMADAPNIQLAGLQLRVAATVKSGVEMSWSACSGTVARTGDEFELSCLNSGYANYADFVNSRCLQADDFSLDAGFAACCRRETWWPVDAAGLAAPVRDLKLGDRGSGDSLDPLADLNTAKGIFCACTNQVLNLFDANVDAIKWIALVLAVWHSLAFMACFALCCAGTRRSTRRGKVSREEDMIAE